MLVGTVDMDRSQRAVLDQVALDQVALDQPADRVTALVFGPNQQMAEFDEHGCLASGVWREMPVAIEREQIAVVDGPAEQADAVLRALAQWNDTLAADEVTVGAADESVVPYLEQRLAEAGLVARFGAGTPLARSGPLQLVELLADYLERGQYADLAALARHPDVGAWLAGQGVAADYLSSLDRFYGEQLPAEIDHERPAKSTHGRDAAAVSRRLAALVAPLAGKDAPARRVGRADSQNAGRRVWRAAARSSGRVRSGGVGSLPARASACVETFRLLDAGSRSPASNLTPPASGAAALRLVVERIDAERLPPPALAGAVEVLGWLELPLDDAAGLIVTGVNEGLVPSVGSGDLFLPDRLRGALGLEDNDRRYARDNYALNLLAASRRLRLIAGRRGPDGEPLVPSRLLFACGPSRNGRAGAAVFCSDHYAAGQPTARLDLPGRPRAGQATSDFAIPRPRALAGPGDVAAGDRAARLSGLSLPLLSAASTEARNTGRRSRRTGRQRFWFAVAHGAQAAGRRRAGRFARRGRAGGRFEPAVGRGGGRAIRQECAGGRSAASRASPRAAGGFCPLAGPVAGQRLSDPAQRALGDRRGPDQSARRSGALPATMGRLIFAGGSIGSTFTRPTGETIVFDYKTGDTAKTPDGPIRRRRPTGSICNCRCIAIWSGRSGIEQPVRLGYIVLPKDSSEVAEHLADWTEQALADADAKALEVMGAIRAEKFWPPAERRDALADVSRICRHLPGRFAGRRAGAGRRCRGGDTVSRRESPNRRPSRDRQRSNRPTGRRRPAGRKTDRNRRGRRRGRMS